MDASRNWHAGANSTPEYAAEPRTLPEQPPAAGRPRWCGCAVAPTTHPNFRNEANRLRSASFGRNLLIARPGIRDGTLTLSHLGTTAGIARAAFAAGIATFTPGQDLTWPELMVEHELGHLI